MRDRARPAWRCWEAEVLAKPLLCYKQLKMKEIFLRNLTILILYQFSLTRIQEEAKFPSLEQKIESKIYDNSSFVQIGFRLSTKLSYLILEEVGCQTMSLCKRYNKVRGALRWVNMVVEAGWYKILSNRPVRLLWWCGRDKDWQWGRTWVILVMTTLGERLTLSPAILLFFQEGNHSDTVSNGGNAVLAIARNLYRNENQHFNLF